LPLQTDRIYIEYHLDENYGLRKNRKGETLSVDSMEYLTGGIAYMYLVCTHMSNTEGKKISQPQITAEDSNAEYLYIIDDKEVWFIDYIIGIAFKTPIDFRTINRYGIGLLESGRSYTELYDIKEFQDYMEEKVGQEIDIESSIDPVTKLEKDDKRIVFRPDKKSV
jgi:hypothetical protein